MLDRRITPLMCLSGVVVTWIDLRGEQRARFRFLLNAYRRARRIAPLGEQIGSAMVRRLGVDGPCSQSQPAAAE